MTEKVTQAPDPGRVRCRWCEDARRVHHDTLYCAHCDDTHDMSDCETCKRVGGRTDSREFTT